MERPNFTRPIAHRGLHDRALGVIENSRTAFGRALERGFDIECDVQLSADGIPVIFHDDHMQRLTGTRALISSRTAKEITDMPLLDSAASDRPQRLTEFLEQIDGKALVQLELKKQTAKNTPILAQAVAEILARYDGTVVVESFDPRLLVQIRKFGFRGAIGIITEGYTDAGEDYADLTGFDRFVLRHLLHWPMTKFDFISCDKTAVNLPAIRLFRRLGMPFTIWTIRSEIESALAISSGAQIVFEGFDPDTT